MNWQSYFLPQRLVLDSSEYNERIEVVESYGRRRLLVNGIEQTGGYTESLFEQGLKTLAAWHMGPMRHIAVLGVGGGGVFSKLRKLYPDAHLAGVDIDEKIINIAQEYFHLKTLPSATFQVSDALKFAEKKINTGKFDCVIIDIYTGNDVPDFVTNAQFIRSVFRLVRRDGSVMVNYFSFRNQKEKSSEFQKLLLKTFRDVISELNHKNIFVYCRK